MPIRTAEATLICQRRTPEASESIAPGLDSDGVYDLEWDHEVVGLVMPWGGQLRWRTFLPNTSRYYRETVTRQLRWPAHMLGRLAAYCTETYQGEAYELYCGGGQRVSFEPQAGLRWNCHQFASRMRPDLSWRLKESLGYPALNIGMSPLLDAAQVIASDMTKNTVPYGIAIEKMLTDRVEVHSFIGTNLPGQSLSVVGGLRPLCLTPNRELSRKYAGDIHPFAWENQDTAVRWNNLVEMIVWQAAFDATNSGEPTD